MDLLKKVDPDLYRIAETLSYVRNAKYGSFRIVVTGGELTLIEITTQIKIR